MPSHNVIKGDDLLYTKTNNGDQDVNRSLANLVYFLTESLTVLTVETEHILLQLAEQQC